MRPVKLHIQAMGPYRGEEVIDFTLLGDRRFFLIHGPTGSGKTSVLDAMTYALYGSTSGDERSLEQMRSHWADGDTESYVQFDFFIGDRLYRIRRRPGQVLNKKRGTGTRSIDPDATLWSIGGEEAVLASGATKVTKKIESLLGFNGEQFRQVIVLPQGKFRELLSAKAEGREEILKVLFGTGRFTLIQNMIKDRAASVKGRLDQLRLERNTVLAGEGVEKEEEMKEALSGAGDEIKELNVLLKKLRADEKTLDAEFKKASVVESRFVEMESAMESLSIAESEKPEMERLEEVLDTCRRAAGLKDFYKSLNDERTVCGEQQKTVNSLRDKEGAAGEEKKSAEEAFRTLPEKEAELKRLEQELYSLESVSGSYTELDRLESGIAVHEKNKKSAEDLLSSLTEEREKLHALLANLQGKISGAEIAAAKIQVQQNLMEKIVAVGKKIAEQEKLSVSFTETEREISKLEKAAETAMKKLRENESARKNKEGLWIRGQAAVISGTLSEGDPCPVCGSIHHPSPARAGEDVPSIDEIESLRMAEKEISEELKKIENEVIRKKASLEFLQKQKNSGDDIPEEFGRMSRDELRVLYEAERENLKSMEITAGSLDSLKGKLAENEKRSEQVNSQIEENSLILKKAEIELTSLEGRISQLRKGLPEGIPDMKSLKEKTGKLEKRAAELKAEINGIDKNFHTANQKYTAVKTLLDKSEKDFIEAGKRLSSKNLQFQQRLSDEKFLSEDEFNEALKNSGTVKDIEETLKKFKERLISASDRAKRASEGIENLERPDLESMSVRISELKEETEDVIGRIKGGESAVERISKALKKIEELDLLLESEEKNYGIIQTLSETAGGRNRFRLTFQRYVLQSLFEDVLMIASNRLERMSRGRYRLISPGKVEDRRMAGGLDLEIFDEYTGYSRPVVTLSGGEAFLASLSLALGLADLVQQYSGGIYLDTVFIDEGFGSLDSETLDLAVNTLVDLQSSGRLVGIISHVNELRERIDARLEIVPEACGSITKFVV